MNNMNLGNQLRSKHLFNRTYSALPVKKFYLDLQFLVIFFPLQNTVSHTHDTICKISMVSGSCCLSRLISHHCSLAHSTPSTHLPISQVFQDTSHTGGCFCIPQTPPLNKHIFFFWSGFLIPECKHSYLLCYCCICGIWNRF